MRDHGWRVSVIAGIPLIPAPESGTEKAAGWIIGRERHAGVDVFRARGTRLSKRRFIGRFTNYMTYFASACLAGLRLERPDLIVALTDPPIIGLAACLASRRYGVPFVMSYRDVFPEVARLLEDFHVESVNAILQRVNRFLVAHADRDVETVRSDVAARCVGELASFQRPRLIRFVPEIPLEGSGKTMRRRTP